MPKAISQSNFALLNGQTYKHDTALVTQSENKQPSIVRNRLNR